MTDDTPPTKPPTISPTGRPLTPARRTPPPTPPPQTNPPPSSSPQTPSAAASSPGPRRSASPTTTAGTPIAPASARPRPGSASCTVASSAGTPISQGTLEADLADTLPEIPDELTYNFTINPAARLLGPRAHERAQRHRGRRALHDPAADRRRRRGRQPRPLLLPPGRLLPHRLHGDPPASAPSVSPRKSQTPPTSPTSTPAPGPGSSAPKPPRSSATAGATSPTTPPSTPAPGPSSRAGFVVNSAFHLRRSENWWKDDLPIRPEGISFLHVDATTAESAYRAGQIDAIDFPLAKTAIDDLRADFPHHTAYERPHPNRDPARHGLRQRHRGRQPLRRPPPRPCHAPRPRPLRADRDALLRRRPPLRPHPLVLQRVGHPGR